MADDPDHVPGRVDVPRPGEAMPIVVLAVASDQGAVDVDHPYTGRTEPQPKHKSQQKKVSTMPAQ